MKQGLNEWSTTTPPSTPKKVEVEDKVPEIKVSIPDTKPVSMMPNVQDPVMGYRSSRRVGRGAFHSSEYNLAEIGRVEDTDGYVRQAFGKKTALMFKEGWDLVGKNPRTIKYVKTRLAQIAQATGIPTNTLFRNIGRNVVTKSNAFLVKVRDTNKSGGKVRRVPGQAGSLKPVAGYFPLPAETMKFKLENNRVTGWKQQMPDGEYKEYAVKDIVHIFHDRKDGFIFGTPTITPVIDDIRALRKIEENIELLVYQHLFPLFQYKVGTENAPAGYTERGEREIDVVKREIMYMPTEGGIVTPERHEITAIGSEGRALRAEGYLDHFKKRVFSGLGVSAVDMGEGETANRATADNMSRNLVDGVKDLQQVVEDAVNILIINELLLESTFGEDVLSEDNVVTIKFKEIDVDAQIKKEAHIADQFNKDLIEHSEARRRMGLEPWVIPSPDEVQAGNDTPENYPEWNYSRWKMFRLPELLIQALDEPYSPVAQASAADSSLPMTQKGNEEATKQEIDKEVQLEKERGKAKVAVAKATPRPKPSAKKVKDSFLHNTYVETKKDVIERVARDGSLDHDWVSSLIRTQLTSTIRRLQVDQLTAFRSGYSRVASVETQRFIVSASNARLQFQERSEHYVNKLTESVINSLRRNVNINTEDVVQKTRAVFDALEYRTSFIEDVEVRKANTLGYAIGLRDTKPNSAIVSQATSDEACPTCRSRDGVPLDVNALVLDMVPPHHANCSCGFTRVDSGQLNLFVQNNADEPLPEQKASGDIKPCPNCNKTAIRVKDSPDTFVCRFCKTSFRVKDEEEAEDKIKRSKHAEFRRCVSKVKARLKSKNPEMEDDELQSKAEIACEHIRNSLEEDENLIEDATLEECVLATKKSLRKQHPDWSADKIKSSAFAICNSKRKGK